MLQRIENLDLVKITYQTAKLGSADDTWSNYFYLDQKFATAKTSTATDYASTSRTFSYRAFQWTVREIRGEIEGSTMDSDDLDDTSLNVKYTLDGCDLNAAGTNGTRGECKVNTSIAYYSNNKWTDSKGVEHDTNIDAFVCYMEKLQKHFIDNIDDSDDEDVCELEYDTGIKYRP